MVKLRRRYSAFTIIELLVVVSILLILSGAIVALINPAQQFARSRDSRRRTDIEAIRQALELYRAANPAKLYPADSAEYLGLAPTHINPLPVEPDDGLDYRYTAFGGGATYSLCTDLELTGVELCVYQP